MMLVGILAAAAALASPPALDPQALPELPVRGFAQDTRVGVQLETTSGRPLGVLRGLDLAPDKAVSHQLLMRDRRGHLFVLDLHRLQVRRYFEAPSSVSGLSPDRRTDSTRAPRGAGARSGSRSTDRPGASPSSASSHARLGRSGIGCGQRSRRETRTYWRSGQRSARCRLRSWCRMASGARTAAARWPKPRNRPFSAGCRTGARSSTSRTDLVGDRSTDRASTPCRARGRQNCC